MYVDSANELKTPTIFPKYYSKEEFTELIINDDKFNRICTERFVVCTRDLTEEEIILNPNGPKRIIIY
jgi:hypothetical protein